MQASHTIIVKKAKTKLEINLDLKVKQMPANKVDSDKTSNLSNTVLPGGIILIFSTIKTKLFKLIRSSLSIKPQTKIKRFSYQQSNQRTLKVSVILTTQNNATF